MAVAILVGGCGGGPSHSKPRAGSTVPADAPIARPDLLGRGSVVLKAARADAVPALTARTVFADDERSFGNLALADTDGDGRLDIVAGPSDGEHAVLVLRNRGGLRFERRETSLRGFQMLGDVDGDRFPDGVSILARGGVVVARGDGRGGFEASRIVRAGALPRPGEVKRLADVNGDGRLDIVVANRRFGRSYPPDQGIAVLKGEGAGRFAAASYPTTVDTARGLQVVDLDEDSHPELVTETAILPALGGGRFGAARRLLPRRPGFGFLQTTRGSDVLAYHATLNGDRVAVVNRGASPLPGIGETALTFEDRGFTPEPINAADFASGPGLDVVIGDPLGVWLSQTTEDGRFTVPVPTLLQSGAHRVAIGDLDGDRRSDIAVIDQAGRVSVLRNGGAQPLARLQLPPTAAYLAADRSVRLRVRCTTGAGSCLGVLRVGVAGSAVRLAPGFATTLRVVLVRPPRTGSAVPVRFISGLREARRRVRISAARQGERAAACRPQSGERVMARSRKVVVLDLEDGVPQVCVRATGAREDFGDQLDQAADSVAAAYEDRVAMVEDVCPGGFEGCWLGLSVRRFPGGRQLTGGQWGTAVGSVAVGRGGALAFLDCAPLDETVECDPEPGGDVYRLDARGLSRVGRGDDIPVGSLRGSSDGRSFSWVQGGRRRTARWSGAPPASLPGG